MSRMGMSRPKTTLIVAVGLIGLLVQAPSSSADTGPGCATAHRNGRWTTVEVPPFPATVSPSQQLPVYDHRSSTGNGAGYFPGTSASQVYATDGATLKRTNDVGCSWSTLFSLSPSQADPATAGDSTFAVARLDYFARIVDVDASPGQVVLTIQGSIGAILAVSQDDGRSWRLQSMTDPCEGSVYEITNQPVTDPASYPYVLAISTDVVGADIFLRLYDAYVGRTDLSLRPPEVVLG